MAQQTIVGSDTVKDALKTKVNANDTELYTIKTEVENARDGETNLITKQDAQDTLISTVTTEVTNARDGEASLLAKQNAQDASIAALAAGSGVVISANDTTVGYVNGKLIVGEGIDFTENDDGGDETLTISCEDASTTNKGIIELATQVETEAGSSGTHVITPASLNSTLINVDTLYNNLILEIFRRMMGDSQVGADAFQDGWVDEFEDDSSLDTGNSSGYLYDINGDTFQNYGTIGIDSGKESTTWEDSYPQYSSICKIAANKFCIAYADAGDGNKGKCIVASVNNYSVSFGTVAEFHTGATKYISCCNIEDDKVFIAYQDDADSDYGKCLVATISGTTITPDTANEVTFLSGITVYISCCLYNTNKVAVCYGNNTLSRGRITCVSISGTVSTVGNTDDFYSVASPYSVDCCSHDTDDVTIVFTTSGDDARVVCASILDVTPSAGTVATIYDGTAHTLKVEKVDTDVVVCVYNNSVTSVIGRVITIASTTPTVQAATTIVSQDSSLDYSLDLTNITTNKVLITWENEADGSIHMSLLTRSGNDLSAGTDVIVTRTASTSPVIASSSATQAVVAYVNNGTNDGFAKASTTLTTEGTLVFNSYEAETEPTQSRIITIMEDTDAVTLNTHVKAYASNDDGSTYEQITLVDEGDWETNQKIIIGEETMTAQSDQTTRLKLWVDSSKRVKFHGVANFIRY